MSIWQRLLAAIGRVLSAFFNIRIKLKYVLVLVILLVAGCIGVTYNKMINAVGGKADYDESVNLKIRGGQGEMDKFTDMLYPNFSQLQNRR